MMHRALGVIGASSAALAIAAGAFGAHALRTRITPDLLAVFETGVRYQVYHALGILLVFLTAQHVAHPGVRAAGWLFVAGTVLFSGSLYALSLSGIRGFGAVTPLGGLCFIAGWLALAAGIFRGS